MMLNYNDAVMPSDLTKLVLLITLASCLHVFMRVSSPNYIILTILTTPLP